MPRAETSRVVELAPGVFALSNLVDLSTPRTWVSPDAAGFDPSTAYLVVDGGEAQLIDTGFRAHGPAILDQIASVIGDDTPLHVVSTRIEPDCLGNIDRLVDRFPVKRILGQTNVVPLDYIGPLSHRYPHVEIDNGLRPGDAIAFGAGRTLDVVEPAVRTLPTIWLRDGATRTLFTSDFFGGIHLTSAGAWAEPSEDVETVLRHLLAKFDWLAIADTSLALQRLDRAFAEPVATIAPGHGLWTRGDERVASRLTRFRAALLAAGRQEAMVPPGELTAPSDRRYSRITPNTGTRLP